MTRPDRWPYDKTSPWLNTTPKRKSMRGEALWYLAWGFGPWLLLLLWIVAPIVTGLLMLSGSAVGLVLLAAHAQKRGW